MKPDCFYDFEELKEMNLPEELLSLIRQTLDSVLLSKKPEKVTCDLKQVIISQQQKRIINAGKNSVEFSIYPSGLIFLEILNGEKIE